MTQKITRAAIEADPKVVALAEKVPAADMIAAVKACPSEALTAEQWADWIAAYARAAAPPDEPKEPKAPPAAAKPAAEKERSMSDAPAPSGAPVPNADPPQASPEAALVARIAEATGMDPAAVLEALAANLDAVIAAIGGGSAPMADKAALAEVAALKTALAATETKLGEATRRAETYEARIAAVEPTVKSLSEKVAGYEKRDADAAKATRDAQVERLVKSNQLPESARAPFVALGDKDPAQFAEALKAFRLDLADVPLGRETTAHADPRTKADPKALDGNDPKVRALRERWNALLPANPRISAQDRATQIDNLIRRQTAAG